MMHLKRLILLTLLGIQSLAAEPTLTGLWQTFDDDGKATGYVRFSENNGEYTGVIEKGLPGDSEEKYCTACTDERKGKKLLGMTIIKHLRAEGDHFTGPEILEPFSGNTYRVKLSLHDAGKKLEVRGFIGLSLFGRSQMWERAG